MCAKSLQLCPTLCNPIDSLAHQGPLSMEFCRQEYWSGLPCPLPGDLPDPAIELKSFISYALAGRFFTTSTTWEALCYVYFATIFFKVVLKYMKRESFFLLGLLPGCLWPLLHFSLKTQVLRGQSKTEVKRLPLFIPEAVWEDQTTLQIFMNFHFAKIIPNLTPTKANNTDTLMTVLIN